MHRLKNRQSKMMLTLFLFGLAHQLFAYNGPLGPRMRAYSPQFQPDTLFGDMMLTDSQRRALRDGEDMGGNAADSHGYAAVTGNNLRWTNAVIPYEIDCSLENMPSALDAVNKAMQEWENKTCIRFVKRTNEKYYLKYFRSTHCWAYVGMVDYSRISVGDGCDYQHVMTHEIGHVVGFYHEQNRLDRDNWVNIHWENIGQFKDAFDLVNNTDSLGVEYDYASIMHYPWHAFSSNGKDTMSPKRDTQSKTPYIELSKGDAEQTSLMYNCPLVLKKREIARKKRHIGELAIRKRQACDDNNQYCADWANAGHCSTSTYVQENCLKSCKSPKCASPGGETCEDGDRACPSWAASGHCLSNSAVRALCPNSCRVCTSSCKDEYDDCPAWAGAGHCELNLTVLKKCQLSCNSHCKGPTQRPVTTKPPVTPTRNTNFLGFGELCMDAYPDCVQYAKEGRCSNDWEQRNCLKSCKSASSRCDDGVQKPPGSCANPLGLSWDGTYNFAIPDSAFYSPAHLSPGSKWEADAQNARLYFKDDHDKKRIGAWCAKNHDQVGSPDGYVQVDLGQERTIQYIATQGRDRYFERVSKFKIAYSSDGQTFQTYQENGQEQIFDGNCDHFTPVLNKFNNMIRARYMRFIPVESNYPCVRMEFYGC